MFTTLGSTRGFTSEDGIPLNLRPGQRETIRRKKVWFQYVKLVPLGATLILVKCLGRMQMGKFPRLQMCPLALLLKSAHSPSLTAEVLLEAMSAGLA